MPELPTVHRPAWADRVKRRNDLDRARRNQAKRCYSTSHPTWRKLRARVLAEQPLCWACQREGRITPANTVDHIDGDTYNNSRDNLAAMCRKCHTAKGNAAGEIGWQTNRDGNR